MAEDLIFGVSAQDNGSVKRLQKDLKATELAAGGVATKTAGIGPSAQKVSSQFFSMGANAKALFGNIGSMVGQWSVFAAAVAGTHGMMKAIADETERLKAGMTAVGETGLTQMSLKMMEESGQVAPGTLKSATDFYSRTRRAGLQFKETDVMRAAEILGPIAQERNIPMAEMLNAVADMFLRSKGEMSPVQAAAALSAAFKTGEVGRLSRMGYVGIDTDQLDGMSIEERVAEVTKQLFPQMQGAALLNRIMTEDTSEAQRAQLGLAEISRKNAEAEAAEGLADMNRRQLLSAQQYRANYQNIYGVDPGRFGQMWLANRLGDYLAFAEQNPESWALGPIMSLHSKLGAFGRFLTPLGLLRNEELPDVNVRTVGAPNGRN